MGALSPQISYSISREICSSVGYKVRTSKIASSREKDFSHRTSLLEAEIETRDSSGDVAQGFLVGDVESGIDCDLLDNLILEADQRARWRVVCDDDKGDGSEETESDLSDSHF